MLLKTIAEADKACKRINKRTYGSGLKTLLVIIEEALPFLLIEQVVFV